MGHFVCKLIADAQLVYDFSALNRGPNPVHVIFSLKKINKIHLYARVGNLQPFARIHKSWTVLVCNVVLGLMVECRHMSLVDSAYTLTHTHTHTHTHSLTLTIATLWGYSFVLSIVELLPQDWFFLPPGWQIKATIVFHCSSTPQGGSFYQSTLYTF